ncbi:hypothetical protein MG293_020396 [Ovis ammon polii]|uniref:Uncharacterized protein n=1 Tax=Ovis ammon polii TaxID=230172 RepID=A0AAD4TL06_OVIAM|nr:hypothetical protein MG293_020396 [Ovis ammon polii]
MNTVLSRANSLFAFSLSVMAALTFGCFITTAFKDRSVPVRLHVSRIMLFMREDKSIIDANLERFTCQFKSTVIIGKPEEDVVKGITNLDAYEQETGNEDGQVKYLAFFLNTGEKDVSIPLSIADIIHSPWLVNLCAPPALATAWGNSQEMRKHLCNLSLQAQIRFSKLENIFLMKLIQIWSGSSGASPIVEVV